MLVFPGWRTEGLGLECRRAQWAPHPRLAAYVAPPHHLSISVNNNQIEDEYSSSSCGSSPEHGGNDAWSEVPRLAAAGSTQREGDECVCEWEGCGLVARGVVALSAHVARAHAHPKPDGLFYCAWRHCARPHRGFNARYKMLVHVRTHTNEKPHACPQCHKCFSRAENLKIHMRSHSGEKPYVCPFEGCNKAYSNSSDRFKHTRTHAVDKPYSCKVAGCDKRYTDPSSLRKHVKTYKHYPAQHTSPPTSPERTQDHTTSISTDPSSYEVRVPTYDMSYVEYSQIYPSSPNEMRYTNYDIFLHKDYSYDSTYKTPVDLESCRHAEDAPLDLKCRRSFLEDPNVKVRSIEDSMEFQLVKAMETPLDLSTKS